MNIHDLVTVLRDMRAVSGDPIVVEVCDDAATAIESLMDRLVRQACHHEVIEARAEDDEWDA